LAASLVAPQGLLMYEAYAAPLTIKVDCTEATFGGFLTLDNSAGIASNSGCVISPTSWAPGSDFTIKITGPTGRLVDLTLIDSSGSQKYTISGSSSDDEVYYHDANDPGKDQVSFSGYSGGDGLFVYDSRANNFGLSVDS